jgi:hypothetical protein
MFSKTVLPSRVLRCKLQREDFVTSSLLFKTDNGLRELQTQKQVSYTAN